MGWSCITHGETSNVYKILDRKPEGKKPFRRPRHKRKDNVDLKEVVWEGVGWIYLVQDRDQWWTSECGNEHLGSIKGGHS